MQVPPERLLTEKRLKHLGSLFAECVREVYKGSLPKAKFTVYMKTPKYDDKGNESITFRYDVSDDTVDDEMFKEQIDLQREPLGQCFLNKIAPNKEREPGRNWVGYYGRVLSLETGHRSISEEQPAMSNESIEDIILDESQWIEIIKFAQRDNWYSKIVINKGHVIGAIIQITASEIWDAIKPHLSQGLKSGSKDVTDLMEKIKDLPLKEISDMLEEIRKILGDYFL